MLRRHALVEFEMRIVKKKNEGEIITEGNVGNQMTVTARHVRGHNKYMNELIIKITDA